jgi:hypothetical protein
MDNVRAMIIADTLATCDAKMLQQVARWLVRQADQKADQLQFALNTEIHELLMDNGFSAEVYELLVDHGFNDKINREVA